MPEHKRIDGNGVVHSKWIKLYYNRPKQYTRICGACLERCWTIGYVEYKYCPWCGAKMDLQESGDENYE